MNRLLSACSSPSRHVSARQRSFWCPFFFLHLNRLWLGVRYLLLERGDQIPHVLGLFGTCWYSRDLGKRRWFGEIGGKYWEGWLIPPTGTPNSGDAVLWGCPFTGPLCEDAPLGGREMGETMFLLASESCLGVRNVLGLCVTQPRRAETRSLNRGRGEPQWLTVSSPAQSLNPTAFHGPECLPKWFPAKTGNYLT